MGIIDWVKRNVEGLTVGVAAALLLETPIKETFYKGVESVAKKVRAGLENRETTDQEKIYNEVRELKQGYNELKESVDELKKYKAG